MSFLVYGAYGYTGELVAREAVSRGREPVLAGRRRTPLEDLATDLGCDSRAFRVDRARDALDGVDCVLNCAGPFADTAAPLVDACVATGADYLDVTGEFEVLEALAGRDGAAADAGVTLLPAVGFDVVPTDCLAAHLADRLPAATHLRLGFDTLGPVSPGTAATAVDALGEGGVVRRHGELRTVPTAWRSRTIDFGDGERTAVTIPWGDVATAYRTTGIGNVEVYAGAPPAAVTAVRAMRPFESLASLPGVKGGLETLARLLVSGPDETERAATGCRVWGEARVAGGEGCAVGDGDGTRGEGGDCGTGPDDGASATDDGGERRAVSRLRTPNTYAHTVDASLAAVERVRDGDAPEGYATPAGAFGPGFVLDLPGVVGFDDEPVRAGE